MNGADNEWSEQGLHYFAAGHGAGVPGAGTAMVGRGRAGAVSWGTEVEIDIGLADDGTVAELRWRCHGCPAVQAACSWIAEQAPGLQPRALLEYSAVCVADALALPPARLGVLLVVEDALRAAVASVAE